ncbi:Cullin binding-domain-containing protein [Scheffersomyces coipomensis]|uniref:Cullin binding-domain-containing protein n=1 Tax=Scheffersomyces coipomensis TaxID=1788519 RepID=UPI00315D028D
MFSRSNKGIKQQQEFVEITQSSSIIAASYLKNNNNNLERAIQQYFENTKKSQSQDNTKYDPKLIKLYESYQDSENNQLISIEGTIQYLEDLHIEPEDLESLTLAYLLNSTKIGEFEKPKFLKFWTSYKINDLKKMSKFIKDIHHKLITDDTVEIKSTDSDGASTASFKNVYEYTFSGLLEVANQNKIDYVLCTEYWKLLIPILINRELKQEGQDSTIDERESLIYTRLNQWYEFLDIEYKQHVSHDKWTMFYLFVKDIIITDPSTLKDYDEMAAWPSVFDEYVNYLRENELLQ